MDKSILNKNLSKLVSQRNSFLFFSVILVFAVALLSIVALSRKAPRIVVVPTNGASFWLEEGRASEGYVEQMGLFVSDLLLTRSPGDVEKRNAQVLKHVHPSLFHEFKKRLLQEQENMLKTDQSYYFCSDRSYAKGNDFVVEGDFFVLVGRDGKNPAVTQQTHKKYTFKFACENGRLLLKSLKKEDL